MVNRPLILITNDDGIASPGLHAAAYALAELGDLLIVAPSTQQTGAGRSYPSQVDKTIFAANLNIEVAVYEAYHAAVSPAQAVVLALLDLAKRPVDLCVSGINYGENIGSGVTISGTVGAAIEAACFNIPALAVSLETPAEYHLIHSNHVDFSVAAHFTRLFAESVLSNGLPPKVDLLKIDVPASATVETSWRMVRVSRQRYYESIPGERDPKTGRAVGFSYHVNINRTRLEPESDIYAFAVDKVVAVAPMTIDLTAPVSLPDITNHF